MTAVRLEGLTKRFGALAAVDAVDLDIESGEFVVLVGPSGSGKTTCLRMIAGLEAVTSGSIFIGDRDVASVHAKDRDVAMVFQSYALYPHMSVADNMGFALKLKKVPRDEIDRRIQDVATILGITEELPRKPKTLSGGQQQRVALGRAIVRDPAVFLFDEPLSNLDAKLRMAMRGELIKLHHRLSATMIYVTHDQTEAMTMGDRIVVMKDGRIQQNDSPLNLYNHPVNQFVAGFIGSPSMNFFQGRLTNGGDGLAFDEGAMRLPLPPAHGDGLRDHAGQEVVLGIRPEDIHDPETKAPGVATVEIEATVEVVEPMGNEVYLYLTTGRSSFVARVDPLHVPKVEQRVRLAVEVGKAHYFDRETEVSLLNRD